MVDVAPILVLLWLTYKYKMHACIYYSVIRLLSVLSTTYILLFLTCLPMMILNTMTISNSRNTPINIKLEISGTRMPVDELFAISEPVVIMHGILMCRK